MAEDDVIVPELPALSAERVGAILKEKEYRYAIDSDGDLFIDWSDDDRTYFIISGKMREILSIRYQCHRRFDASAFETLAEFCNEWNRAHHFPKAYVYRRKDGDLTIMGELTIDFEHGCTDKQLFLQVSCGLGTGNKLGKAIEERYATPKASA